MNYLLAGHQSTERVDLLIRLTRIDSDDLRAALHDHLVKGHNESSAAILNGVKTPNLNRAVSRLKEVAQVVELIKEIDWAHLSKGVASGS